MEVSKFWAENKDLILKTAAVAIVVLLVIKFFDYIFLCGILIALAVAAVLGWNYLSKKHGGPEGVWKALLSELGVK